MFHTYFRDQVPPNWHSRMGLASLPQYFQQCWMSFPLSDLYLNIFKRICQFLPTPVMVFVFKQDCCARAWLLSAFHSARSSLPLKSNFVTVCKNTLYKMGWGCSGSENVTVLSFDQMTMTHFFHWAVTFCFLDICVALFSKWALFRLARGLRQHSPLHVGFFEKWFCIKINTKFVLKSSYSELDFKLVTVVIILLFLGTSLPFIHSALPWRSYSQVLVDNGI